MKAKEIIEELNQKLDFVRSMDHKTRNAIIDIAREAIADRMDGVHLLPKRIGRVYIPILAQAKMPDGEKFARRIPGVALTPDKLIEDFQLFCQTFLPKRA